MESCLYAYCLVSGISLSYSSDRILQRFSGCVSSFIQVKNEATLTGKNPSLSALLPLTWPRLGGGKEMKMFTDPNVFKNFCRGKSWGVCVWS